MGHSSVVSGYSISTSFRRLTVGQRTLEFWGITERLANELWPLFETIAWGVSNWHMMFLRTNRTRWLGLI